MTMEEIKALIEAEESRTMELKKSTGEWKDGMYAACAFLNTEGGWLISGVTPQSRRIVAKEVTDATKRAICQALAGIDPAYHMPVLGRPSGLKESVFLI